MSEMNLDAAVEAAELAQRKHLRRTHAVPDGQYFACPDQNAVRAALEAAAPSIAATALRDAADELIQFPSKYYGAFPWGAQDWLRDRADSIEATEGAGDE